MTVDCKQCTPKQGKFKISLKKFDIWVALLPILKYLVAIYSHLHIAFEIYDLKYCKIALSLCRFIITRVYAAKQQEVDDMQLKQSGISTLLRIKAFLLALTGHSTSTDQ